MINHLKRHLFACVCAVSTHPHLTFYPIINADDCSTKGTPNC